MTTNGKSGADKMADQSDEMRPLPDGGLTHAMPEWLRRPPAWRDLPARPTPSEDPDLPEPDTSVIDPRTLIDVSDLPPWLQAIAGRGQEAAGDEAPAVVEAGAPDPHPEPTPESRQVPFVAEEPSKDSDSAPASVADAAATLWWQSSMVIAGLGAALLIAVVLILLLATGVL